MPPVSVSASSRGGIVTSRRKPDTSSQLSRSDRSAGREVGTVVNASIGSLVDSQPKRFCAGTSGKTSANEVSA